MREIFVNHTPRVHNPFAPSLAQPYTYKDSVNEAVVVDVIVNDEHSEYRSSSDGFNVGCIKVRFLKTNHFRDDGALNWAFPIDANITDYPLIGEIVLIVESLNKFFYTRKINTSSKVTTHTFPKLNDELQATINSPIKNQQNRQSSISNPNKPISEKRAAGNYFQDKKIFRLKSFEGDIIFEGRSGSSIRFGAAFKNNKYFTSSTEEQSPNLLLRVGQDPNATPTINSQFGLVLEDINKDAGSVWMVSDQTVPITLSTESNKTVHSKSVPDFPTVFSGNQIFLNSDRLVLNSKIDKIILNSNKGIHLTTLKNATIDTADDYVSWIGRDVKIEVGRDSRQNYGRDYNFWIGRSQFFDIRQNFIASVGNYIEMHASTRMSFISNKIYIGSINTTTEPMVLGNTLMDILSDIIDAHIASASRYVFTSTGPGQLNPQVQAKLRQIKTKLRTILSSDNYVNKNNDLPKSPSRKIPVHT